MRAFFKILISGLLLVSMVSCQAPKMVATEPAIEIAEYPVVEISLRGPIATPDTEISGMAWCGDHLILLPQYPARYGEDGLGELFSIPKVDIQNALATGDSVEPGTIQLDDSDLHLSISRFEGFEAIAFQGEDVYVTVEARQGEHMLGYIVRGNVSDSCSHLTLDPATITAIQPQADLGNMSDETIVILGKRVYTIYEANGVNVNPVPQIHVFNRELEPLIAQPFPTIEYRLTDATTVDSAGKFWVINYFFPGDTKLKPADDAIRQKYGIGLTHAQEAQVERLVAMNINEEGIVLSDAPPIYLVLSGATARNWEGLVRYDDGFLLVTDEHPTTILGYIDLGEDFD